MHVPSQPLMRPPLSRFPTPADSSQSSRFFQVWKLFELPLRADHPAYFGLAKFYLRQPFQPSTKVKLNICGKKVNAAFRCKGGNSGVEIRPSQAIEIVNA